MAVSIGRQCITGRTAQPVHAWASTAISVSGCREREPGRCAGEPLDLCLDRRDLRLGMGRVSVAMKKSSLVATSRSPLVAR
jgi:hypothetical protein